MSRFTFLLLLAAPLVAAPVPKGLKKCTSLDGVWVVTNSPPGTMEEQWTIRGQDFHISWITRSEKFTSYFSGGTWYEFATADQNDPNATDILVTPLGGEGTKRHVGRQELAGDVLRVTYVATPGDSTKRPSRCEPGTGLRHYELRRVDELKSIPEGR